MRRPENLARLLDVGDLEARFYVGPDGDEWIEISGGGFMRGHVIRRPAVDVDRERFAAFRGGEKGHDTRAQERTPNPPVVNERT